MHEGIPEPPREETVIEHIRGRFSSSAAMVSIIETECFRKGMINLSVRELYERLSSIAEELFIKVSRSIPQGELGAALLGVLTKILEGTLGGEEASQTASDLANWLQPPMIFYCLLNRKFLTYQVNMLHKMQRGLPMHTSGNHRNYQSRDHFGSHHHHNNTNNGNNNHNGTTNYHHSPLHNNLHNSTANNNNINNNINNRSHHHHQAHYNSQFAPRGSPVGQHDGMGSAIGAPFAKALGTGYANNSTGNMNAGPSAAGCPGGAGMGGAAALAVLGAGDGGADRRGYQTAHACVDFMHGRCARGDACRFSHSAAAQSGIGGQGGRSNHYGAVNAARLNNGGQPVTLGVGSAAGSHHEMGGERPLGINAGFGGRRHLSGVADQHAAASDPPHRGDEWHQHSPYANVVAPPPSGRVHSTGHGSSGGYAPSASSNSGTCNAENSSVSEAPVSGIPSVTRHHPQEASLEPSCVPTAHTHAPRHTTAAAGQTSTKVNGHDRLRAFMANNAISGGIGGSGTVASVGGNPHHQQPLPSPSKPAQGLTAVNSLLQVPVGVTPVQPLEGALGERASPVNARRLDAHGGADIRAVLWLRCAKGIPLADVKAAVGAMGRCFDCGYADTRGVSDDLQFDWIYFKLSTYDRELQARRHLVTAAGDRLVIADRTLFTAGHKDDGFPPALPDDVHRMAPIGLSAPEGQAQGTPGQRRFGAERGGGEVPICKYFLKDSCTKGDACPFRHEVARSRAHAHRHQQGTV